jgi:glycine/D-amino acid oxidase-like deaminating enzyme/nitrite reductase/ring-hydroxylating ferredoxin subunit
MLNNDSGISQSVWMRTAVVPDRPPLREDVSADVCIVGAGIAGLTTAYMLARKGVKVIVLDDGPIGGGATGRTTAHLASALDDRYFMLEERLGEKHARLAAESHAAAINAIEAIVRREGIDCDFKRVDGYLLVPPSRALEGADLVEKEFKAARRAGLKVRREVRAPLRGYNTGLCLRFREQAQFHPLKYLAGLARGIESAGGIIHTRTHAARIRGGADARVITSDGRRVRCDAIVVATGTPVNNRVRIHTRQAPYRTYVVAMWTPRGAIEEALYWDGFWSDKDESYHYVRVQRGPEDAYPGEDPEAMYDLLIVGGSDHKTGQAHDFEERFARLEEWARVRFPEAQGTVYRWSGQVYEPVDGMAYIGRNPGGAENVFIATGDSGNGMTHGTIAGMLLTDLIRGIDNPWKDLYSPSRSAAGAAGAWWSENLNVARQYRAWLGRGEVDSAEKIAPGTGAVIRRGLRKVAVYRAPDGALTECSATCPHMKAVVTWNAAEKTWDCPAHGSRFDPRGRCIAGPANVNLRVLRTEPAELKKTLKEQPDGVMPTPVEVPEREERRWAPIEPALGRQSGRTGAARIYDRCPEPESGEGPPRGAEIPRRVGGGAVEERQRS